MVNKLHGRGRAGRLLTVITAAIVAVALAPPTAAMAAPADPSELSATALPVADRASTAKAASSRLAESDPTVLEATGSERVPVMVKLDYDSVATYSGGVPNLAPTSPAETDKSLEENAGAVQQYEQHIAGVEDEFVADLSAAVPDATVGTRLRTVYGGMAVQLPADQAKRLLDVPGVVAVQADQRNQPLTDSSPAFIGAPTIYDALGSSTEAGQGVIVGILDTGAWPEHPSFADPDQVLPAPRPRMDGTARVCDFGDNPLTPATDVFACNNKLIAGRPFLETYHEYNEGEVYPDSARDSNGHGTHTASTSAGSPVAKAETLGVDRGAIQGIAPGAHVAVYKVCGTEGCYSSDSADAVQQAIDDGVDVINFSISGGTDPYTDPVELAFLDAYAAGVFVATSAGNEGPGAGTVNHLSPWVTTVGASTQTRAFQSTLTVTGSGAPFVTTGASITAGAGPAPVVLASAAPYGRALCDAPAPAGSFAGKIVACQRGTNARVEKGFNVLQGGAVGMILYNPALADVETDNHWLPTVHLADGRDFVAYLTSNPGATAMFTAGTKAEGQGDVMAAFSSRGPAGTWMKPDVTAPGVEILAGHTPTPESNTGGPPGNYFQAIAGTSMSSPHVAGSAALLRALHPDWTPGQIKSALMTSAVTEVVKEDTTTPADPYDMGAGRIDLTRAGDPGVTFDVTARQFRQATDDVARIELNQPSVNVPTLPGTITTHRTATNVTGGTVRYRVSTTAPQGVRITARPQVFALRKGQSVELTITIDAVGVPVDPKKPLFGRIQLDEIGARNRDAHLPVAFTRGPAAVTLTSSCDPTTITLRPLTESTCAVTAANQGAAPVTVDLRSSVSNRLRISSVTGASRDGTTAVTLRQVQLAGSRPGDPSIATGNSPRGFSALSVAPEQIEDEEILNFDVPEFTFNAEKYTRIGVTSNGYAVVGGGDAQDVELDPPGIPDVARPNNVLAPFWTDLDGTGAPGVAAALVTAGANRWLVFQWQVNVWGTTSQRAFQLWIGLNGSEDISFAYDPANLPADPNGQTLVVGVENSDGSGGEQIDGPPTGDLRVTGGTPTPGDTATYSFTVQGATVGQGRVTSTLDSKSIPGTTVETETIKVVRRAG